MKLNTPSCLLNRPRLMNPLHVLHIVDAYSQMTDQELACLQRHATGRRLAVEIGTFMGVSAGHTAKVLAPGGTLYCVDPYSDDSPIWAICKRHLRRLGLLERVVFLQGLTAEMTPLMPRECDLFFVDGDHSYIGLKTDWQIVLGFLAVGGIACFHDTTVPSGRSNVTPGSVQFFGEVIAGHADFEHVETCETLNVLKRTARA